MVVGPAGRAAEPGVDAPGAAAQLSPILSQPGLGLRFTPGPSIAWSPLITFMPKVLAPFPYIAMHVVQAQGIGREAGYI